MKDKKRVVGSEIKSINDKNPSKHDLQETDIRTKQTQDHLEKSEARRIHGFQSSASRREKKRSPDGRR